MFAAVVLGPLGAGWLYGRFGGRLEPSPIQPAADEADLAAQIGKQGVAKRLMTPGGQVQIEGRALRSSLRRPGG